MDRMFSTIMKMSMIPRWGDYSTNFKDNTANHSYRVASYALILAKLENKKNKHTLNEEKLILKALFHDVNEVLTGPIRFETKNNKKLKKLIQLLEKNKSEEVLDMLPPGMKDYFSEYIVDGIDDSIEGKFLEEVDSFDAFIFSRREVRSGNTVYFSKVYERLYNKLVESPFESIREAVAEVNKEESDFKDLLQTILNMDKIKRWSGRINHFDDDDAMHSYRVAAFLALLAKYEEITKQKKYDLTLALGKALFHDLAESITGDINGPVKHSSKKLKGAFESFEKQVSKELLEKLPAHIQPEFEKMFLYPKDTTKAGTYVDIMDKTDALMKSLVELGYANNEYRNTYKKQLKILQRKYKDEYIIEYFLKEILHDLYFYYL